MALSKPILGIQSPIQCQLCEKDPKISWKCLVCDLLMCSVCKNNIHPKIKTAGEHRIIEIKDIGSTSSSSMESANVDITLVDEYQTKVNGVFHLAISLDSSLWIGYGDRKKGIRLFSSHSGLQKVKCEGNRLKVVSSFNIDVRDIAVTPDNDLIIASYDSILKQIKSGTNKVFDTVYNLEKDQPLSIHVTRKNKLIVRARTDKNQYLIVILNHEGNRENVYGEDQTKDFSFSRSCKIAATNNDNIFVVDKNYTEGEGRVVVLRQGDITNIYSGQSVINTEDIPFKPMDLTITPTDNVIVADIKSSTLHILNSSGHLITYISLKDKGIYSPVSIELAMAGHICMLYIGTPADDTNLYKLIMIGC